MATIYVQFTDSTKAAIALVFGCEQDATQFPNQGTVDSSDPIYKTFYDAMVALNAKPLIEPT